MNWKEKNNNELIRDMGKLVTLIYDYAKHWRLDNFNNLNQFFEDNHKNENLNNNEKSSLLDMSNKYPDGKVLKFFTNSADLQCVIGKNPHK